MHVQFLGFRVESSAVWISWQEIDIFPHRVGALN